MTPEQQEAVIRILQNGDDFRRNGRARDFFDAVSDGFLKKNARGVSSFTLAANMAAVIVIAPTGGTITRKGYKRLINGVVDYYTRT